MSLLYAFLLYTALHSLITILQHNNNFITLPAKLHKAVTSCDVTALLFTEHLSHYDLQ